MSPETEPTLDSEGVPDLDGPLPQKVATGDSQEGASPPNDRPRASVDWGTTTEEQIEGEPIGVRVERELPEVGSTDPVDDIVEELALDRMPANDDDDLDEPDAALDLADDADRPALQGDEQLAQSAEEAAMHVVDEGR